MNRQPNTVTAGWPELQSSLALTGYFQDDQLNPEAVLYILADLVRRHTTVIGYVEEDNLRPIGSGTFVRRVDGQCGILTAGHVIQAIKGKERIHVLPAQRREDVAWIWIEGKGKSGLGLTNTGPEGPDIGWIPMSEEEAVIMESLQAVICNRSRKIDDFAGAMCQIHIIFGLVMEASDLSENMVVSHAMFVGVTGSDTADKDGWDYSEFAITSDDDWIPQTHGGVSGSGVWRIDLPMDGNGNMDIRLKGVVYAEGPADDRKLIAHGEDSVRTFLNEE